MEFRVIKGADSCFVPQAASLHYDSLSYRSFITLFGIGFLERLYKCVLADRAAFMVAASEEKKLLGFILAAEESRRVFRTIIQRPHLFLPSVLKTIFRRPSTLKKIAETLFYPSRQGKKVRPELLVMAVRKDRRSQGVGSRLVETLDEAFRERGCRAYKVVVHDVMASSIRFYEKQRMSFSGHFNLYGHRWNVYIKEL